MTGRIISVCTPSTEYIWRCLTKLSDVVGFYFLDLASSYTPPADLAAFLSAGEPPVYVGYACGRPFLLLFLTVFLDLVQS